MSTPSYNAISKRTDAIRCVVPRRPRVTMRVRLPGKEGSS